MYNLYNKYVSGNSIGCCPLYVSYYLLYVLTWELNRYGRRRRTTTTRRHTLNLFFLLNTLMWVYTNSPTWELIGNNTPTWKRIGTVTWVYTNTLTRELNRYRPDQTGPDRTDRTRHTLNLSVYRWTHYCWYFKKRAQRVLWLAVQTTIHPEPMTVLA
jgi:hypothetical protein